MSARTKPPLATPAIVNHGTSTLPADGRVGLAGWAFGILVLAALIGVVLQFGDIEEFLQLARSAKPEWLLLALLAQIGTYAAAGAVWREVLKAAGFTLPLTSLAALAIEKLFADQAIPFGGMSGNLLFVRALARRNVPPRVTMAALLVDMVTYYGSYLLIFMIGLGLFLANHGANGFIFAGATVFTVMVVAAPASVLWARHLGRLRLPKWTARFPRAVALLKAVADAPSNLLRNRALIGRAAVSQMSIFVLDALTLWFSFYALGSSLPFWIAFVAFVAASATATISVIPLGVGSFEAGSVMALHLLGVSLSRALAATLLLRVLNFWLPMIPGLLLTRRELRDEH